MPSTPSTPTARIVQLAPPVSGTLGPAVHAAGGLAERHGQGCTAQYIIGAPEGPERVGEVVRLEVQRA
jgi:hypothetical protein